VRQNHHYFHTIYVSIICLITDFKINRIMVKVRYFVEETRQAMYV